MSNCVASLSSGRCSVRSSNKVLESAFQRGSQRLAQTTQALKRAASSEPPVASPGL